MSHTREEREVICHKVIPNTGPCPKARLLCHRSLMVCMGLGDLLSVPCTKDTHVILSFTVFPSHPCLIEKVLLKSSHLIEQILPKCILQSHAWSCLGPCFKSPSPVAFSVPCPHSPLCPYSPHPPPAPRLPTTKRRLLLICLEVWSTLPDTIAFISEFAFMPRACQNV